MREFPDESVAHEKGHHLAEYPQKFAPLCGVCFVVPLRRYQVLVIFGDKKLHGKESRPERVRKTVLLMLPASRGACRLDSSTSYMA